MAQQINLVNPELRPKRELLTASFIAKVAGGFALVLGLYGWMLVHETAKLAQQRDLWTQRAKDEQARLVQLTQQNPPKTPSVALQEEITAAEAKVKEHEQVLAFLKTGALGNTAGFSAMLQSFARQNVAGLWLTGVAANGSGDQMRISGRTLSPDLIPQYIGKLSGEEALRGRKFTAFQASQPIKQEAPAGVGTASNIASAKEVAASPAYIEFVLSAEKSEVLPSPVEKTANPSSGKS